MLDRSLALVALSLAASVAGPMKVNAQVTSPDSILFRDDCRLAAQVVAEGRPPEKWHWALTRAVDCPDGASILQAAWSSPPKTEHEIALLEYSTRELQDHRLIDVLQAATTRPGASRLSRIAAVSVLLSYLEAGFGLPLKEKLLSGNRWDFALRVTTGASPKMGEDPITAEDRGKIVQWMKSLSASDPDPGMRVLMTGLASAFKGATP